MGQSRRRRFLIAAGALVVAPLAVAQRQGRKYRIGFLAGGSRPESLDSSPYAGFTQGMRELGYVEGRNFVMEWRFAEGQYERLPDLAAELVRVRVDVIVVGASFAVPAAKRATATIPIVMGYSADPVGAGYVTSLARPGGNVTGVSATIEANVKLLQLLRTIAPAASRVAVLTNVDNPIHPAILEMLQTASGRLGATILAVGVRMPEDIERGFARMKRDGAQALIVPPDALFTKQRAQIAAVALVNRLPSIFANREYVEAGGLVSYGQPLSVSYRHAATYVDKILKGAKPADLPVEQPTKFELVINGKTAKTLGITIPSELLLRADRVIE
ncbi:MAG: ABC transporter substrate-binding protein [Betaproteobacteria bacterium]|nr:ABC transporter substrate-binding protein [Betaproteobacteria bacterium]